MHLRLDPTALHDQFKNADPFPHIVMDGLFDDAYLEAVLAQFPGPDEDVWHEFSNENEIKKGYHYERLLRFELQAFMFLMNSPIALLFLEELTGIRRLIPDPYFGGGGPHRIGPGGFLKVHTDFNRHPKLNIYRRLNVLVYLNQNWEEEYGGHLELWDRNLENCVSTVLPTFNRTVVFETSEHSWHGHPKPLTCPADRARQSVSFYYYTAEKPEAGFEFEHATIFRDTD